MRGGHNKTHDTCEDGRKIDSFTFSRYIKSQTPYITMTWTRNGTQVAKIGTYLNRVYIVLVYTHTNRFTGKETNIEDQIYLTWVPCNFGGDKPYFICPYCKKRVRMLYLNSAHYRCRTCACCNYESQQNKNFGWTVATNRLEWIIQTKFKDKKSLPPIDLAFYTPPGRKGMHYQKYVRLIAELHKIQDNYLNKSNKALAYFLK